MTRIPLPHPRRRMPSGIHRRLALGLAALLVASSAVAVQPSPVAADTASDMEALILRTMNEDRVAKSLVGYRGWGALTTLARERAQRMANAGKLSHDAAGGDLGKAFDSRGIQWFGFGETIGVSGWPFGSEAALDIYKLWKGSAPHQAIMYSRDYNYIGIGVAQGSDGRAWISAVYAESVDHTPPVAQARSIWRVGRTIYFTFSGYDPKLQSHTAGVRSFDVQLRRDKGAWRTVRNDITWTKIRLKDRARGHWFRLRVQAADGRGNLSGWARTKRIWVP